MNITVAIWLVVAATISAGLWPLALRYINGTPVAHPFRKAIVNFALAGIIALVAIPAFGAATDSYKVVPVLSGSMTPGMDPGDAAWVSPAALDDLAVGDVILFNAPADSDSRWAGLPVIHRIVETVDPAVIINPDDGARYFRTKGDAVEEADPWIVSITADTLYRRDAVAPRTGTVINELADPDNKKFGFAVLAVIVIGLGIQTIREGFRTDTVETSQPRVQTVSHRARRNWKKPVAVAAVGVGVVYAGSGAWAAFTDIEVAQANLTSGVTAMSVDEGTNRLTVDFNDMVPGQTVSRAIDLEHVGTVALYGAGPNDPPGAVGLQVETTDTGMSPLTVNDSDGLQYRVRSCDVVWTETVNPDGLYDYTCPNPETVLVSDQPILGLANLPSSLNSYEPGGIDHLVFDFTLPVSAPHSYQDETASVTVDFNGIQRDGIVLP